MKKNLILVDQNDNPVGEMGKLDSHLGDAHRHRAFTALIKNKKNQFLMCRRSLQKPLWPTYWDAAFSSHPWVGERVENACSRRIKEELGISIDTQFKNLFSYEYRTYWNEIFSEWEINHITITKINSNIDLSQINPEEVSQYQWMTWKELTLWTKSEKLISPWLSIAIKKIKSDPDLLNRITQL